MAAPAEDIKRLRERLEGHPGPMLSVYLSVNPRYNENQGQAYKVRLKDAFKGIEDLSEDLASQVRESVEGEVHQHARTVVFFVAPDGFFERYDLQVDLPEAYRFGEPYLAPLVLAVDEHETYGVAMVEAEEFRFFVSEPVVILDEGRGAAPESGFFREVDVSPGSPGPRSGMDQEDLSRRTEANIHKFLKDAGELTRKLAFQDNVRHLIIAGTKERTTVFRDQLPQDVKDRVVAEEHVPTSAPAGEIFERLEAAVERSEEEQEAKLIEQVREGGVRGIKDTVEALQEGRVYQTITLWDLDGEIRWCDNDQLAIADITAKECPYCRQETRIRPLLDVVLDLAMARDARVEFVPTRHNDVAATPNEDIEKERTPDEPADVLREEFEGLAGLLRY